MGLVDYARPMMDIERMLKEMYEHCQERQFDEAQAMALRLVTEARLLGWTLQLMAEKKR